jgi:prepilin-type N-terminal cleavage/methylation domain-containing protein
MANDREQAVRSRRWEQLYVLLPVILFGWAGVSKIIEPDVMLPALGFLLKHMALQTLPLLNTAIVVGAFEVLLAIVLLLFPTNRWIILTSIAVLCVYSLILAWFLIAKDAPSCGCLESRFPGNFSNVAGVIRNVGTIGILGWLHIGALQRKNQLCNKSSGQISVAMDSSSARAFSLIEVLVVIAVIGVLIAIILPALAHSRSQAQQLRTLSVLHQLSLATMSYTDDHQDHFPFTAMPEKPWLGVVLPGLPYSVSYFGGQSATYANLLVPHYFTDRAIIDFPGEYGARSRAAQSFMTPYLLTYGAFAPNVYWQGESAPDDLSLYQSAPRYSCTFPANKAMLMHSLSGMYAPHKSSTQLLVVGTRMDGSGITVVLPGDYQDRLADRPYGCQPMPFLATQGGLGGRDF